MNWPEFGPDMTIKQGKERQRTNATTFTRPHTWNVAPGKNHLVGRECSSPWLIWSAVGKKNCCGDNRFGGFKRWRFKQIQRYLERAFSYISWISRCCAPRGLQKWAENTEKGKKRSGRQISGKKCQIPISGKRTQIPLKSLRLLHTPLW